MVVHLRAYIARKRSPRLQPYAASHATANTRRCCCGRRGGSRQASTWSSPSLGSLLLMIALSLPGAEAAGLWGLGGGRADRQQQGGFVRQSNEPDDGEMDEVFTKLQREQFWEDVEQAGMGVLEEEVKEKKSKIIFAEVAKACSIGAQMTLIMGGGALLFRLLPVLLGHDLEDEEEAEANSPYLLQSSRDGNGRPQQALPAASTGERKQQQLLTSGVQEQPKEDATAQVEWEGGGGGVGAGSLGGAGSVGETAEEAGALMTTSEEGIPTAAAGVMVEKDVGVAEERDDLVGEDADVVVNTRTRTALRKARRLSRPYLKAMGPPLALLLLARLALGTVLARRIDPTLELLFGDDIVDLYSVNKKVVHKVDMPYPKDADDVPGRKKMKGKRVQRPPRPEGEKNEEGDAWETESQTEVGL
ncbi:unnamed protein product [Scytosiphon promiscuus]